MRSLTSSCVERGNTRDLCEKRCKDIGVDTNVVGDSAHVLRCLNDETIDLTLTSPPYYNAKEYSQWGSYADYLADMEAVVKELHRVTREGRFAVVNASPVIVPRSKRSDKSTRYPIPFHLNAIMERNGFEFIDDIVWVKPEGASKNRNAGFFQHRKPLAYKPNSVSEYVLVYRKKTDKLIDWNIRTHDRDLVEASKVDDGYERTNVWRINPTYDKNHPAPFPEELAERVIRYYSFKGDLVLDPFVGSGTTSRTARRLDRHFIGIDKNKGYVKIANKELT